MATKEMHVWWQGFGVFKKHHAGVLRFTDGRITIEPDPGADAEDRQTLQDVLTHSAVARGTNREIWAHEEPELFFDSLPLTYSGYLLWCTPGEGAVPISELFA